MKYLDQDGLLYFWDKLKNYFVKKETGKGLSSNDYTDNEKTKLAGVAANANNYTLPNATSSTKGGVIVGSNISLSNGTISITKDNITTALGYTPPTTNTTYTEATISKAGLMSSADKTKLENLDNTIATAVTNAGHLKRTVVSTLPTSNIDTNMIYMVKGAETGDNRYAEWMYIDGNWETIGSTDTDLSGYAKTTDLSKITNTEIETIVAS